MHLSEAEPTLSALFFEFVRAHAADMHSLHILGDCFDAYVGDDDDCALQSEFAAALKGVSDAGTSVYLQHGNRDFLLGDDFAKRCGARLHPEFVEFHIGEHLLSICHGDQFCTDDVTYQNFRSLVRSAAWQHQFLAQPLSARRAFAAQARAQSQAHQQALKQRSDSAGQPLKQRSDSTENQTYTEISDVSTKAIEQHFQSTPATTLLHGHTHRPNVHALSATHAGKQRIVLGDWRAAQASWLSVELDGSFQLHAHGQRWQGRL
jgi:UDP-2,3-diacylglucosamine hydrolase